MKVNETLKKMTLVEKINLLTGKGGWYFNGISRLGIRDFKCSDGPHGVRAFEIINNEYKTLPSTLFPCANTLASSWNQELIYKVGKTIGKECNHYNIDVLLAPGVNGKRNPKAGRNFEYYSEDPYLTGKIATSFINGVQSVKVGTSIKHFILNEQETSRRFASSLCDERTIREIYALPFEIAIKEANPYTVMSSYNRIDGIYASESKAILIDLLRKKLNFKGIVISDWGAVSNKASSINNGLNIQMPEPRIKEDIVELVNQGKVKEGTINQRVVAILKMYEKLLVNKYRGEKTDFDENHKVARLAASEGIVLLKNDGALPLKSSQKVAFIGEFFYQLRMNGGGSSSLQPYKVDSLVEEVKLKGNFPNAYGYKDTKVIKELESEAINVAKSVDKIILFVGTTDKIESEGFDRVNIDLPTNQVSLINKIISLNKQVILINFSGAPVNLKPFVNKVNGIIQASLLGQAGGKPLIDILFGIINPSGRLTETWPLDYENLLTSRSFPSRFDEVIYHEGIYTGYRFFDSFKIPCLFPFGYGLSYSTFEYSNLRLSSNKMHVDERLTVSVDVKNSGKKKGKEVVQLYIKDVESYFERENKSLRAFAKIELKPNETKTVSFILDKSDFAFYSTEVNKFVVEKGEFIIMIGKNVSDIILQTSIQVDSNDQIRKPLTLAHPLSMWLATSPEKEILSSFLNNERQLGPYGHEAPLLRFIQRILTNEGKSPSEIEEEIRKYFPDYK